MYACVARPIDTVYVYNHSDRDLTDYLARLEKAIDNPDVKVVQCKTAGEMVKNSEIICTTTPSTQPVLPDDKDLSREENVSLQSVLTRRRCVRFRMRSGI